MKTNFSMLFYMKKQKNYASGDSPIYLRITVNGNRVEITTGQECKPENWNPKTGRLTGTKEDTKRFNAYLDNLQAMVYRAHKDLAQADLPITAESIRNKFQGKDTATHTLLEAVKNHNKKMKALVGKQYTIGTLKRFEILERHLQAFMLEKHKVSDVEIKEINHAFISDFEFYLRTENSCANNTAIRYLKNFGKIIRICLNLKWIDNDPMFGYKLKSKPVERPFLSEEEIQRIAQKQFSTARLLQVRDVFLFCCFTGLAYADVQKLKLSNITKGVDGNHWIFTNRKKTNIRAAIPLLPSAMTILDRYAENEYCVVKDRAMPVASNQKMNEYLKEIATLCEIDKPLSSHIARHTFATTVTLLNGVPIESVSKMLGHTNIRTTQIYAKVLDIKVGADMALLRDKYQ
ncbi:site-specific integrase [Pedobacter gandavensis]|uniref:site-specific integrase n=1 Tax=Pedobacter gandavensis TaxID=2679963 RepID=UPI00292CCD2E|nr:site-specific integrase [Pedobacter gandavensis]